MSEQIPSGSRSVFDEDAGSQVIPEATPEVVEPVVETTPDPMADKLTKLEEQLAHAQKAIGKQSSEVASAREARKELEALKASMAPKGPTIEEQIDQISEQMENGDLGLREGNRAIAQLSAQLGKQSALSEFQQQRQQEETGKIHKGFLDKNPDYLALREAGAFQPYLDADPLADEYVAYHQLKADEKIKALEAEYQAKIIEAKEQGAKLGAGANNAGKVLGKDGAAARPTGEVQKFKNSRETTSAMEAELARFRAVKE